MAKALWIWELEDDYDDEGSLAYPQSLFEEIRNFLFELEFRATKYYKKDLPQPVINPTGDGIDIFWEKLPRGQSLLINVPRGEEDFSFYGERYTTVPRDSRAYKESIRGTISRQGYLTDLNDYARIDLLAWLLHEPD